MLDFLETIKDKTDDDGLRAINEVENFINAKRYGLVWEEHEEFVDVQIAQKVPVFTEDETKKIIHDSKKPINFLLEGDNLHSLYLLEKTHKGKVDLSEILYNPYAGTKEKVTFDPKKVYDFQLEKTLDEKVLLKSLDKAISQGQKRSIEVEVSNTDRAFGTILGSEITKRLGDDLEEDTYRVLCNGAGGQSFGAFIPKGLTLELVGDSNDYFGKGLSGGKLIVYPPKGSKFKQDENIIIGNVALYGATSGKAFINGVAGERFCVRNSGAVAVVEGVGDHGCEYMTGGRVVVLGKTGKNFAAGMSGGIAYVLDEDNDLYTRLNKTMVSSTEVTSKYDVLELKELIKEHVAYTNSEKGKEILNNFGDYLPKFKKIIPHDYERMLKLIVQMEEKGLSAENAQIEAFYANKINE